ncbi:MAG: helix-turn-helix transcriptional regulator [Clostridia bacterium]|nr:helix-turn-helix transcriptional regulator [Clostridia bacterium]
MDAEQIINEAKKKIKHILDTRKISFYSLAQETGISEATLLNWYSKRNNTPSLYSTILVCKALKIPISSLFIEDESVLYLENCKKDILSKWDLLNDKQKDAILLHMDSYIG